MDGDRAREPTILEEEEHVGLVGDDHEVVQLGQLDEAEHAYATAGQLATAAADEIGMLRSESLFSNGERALIQGLGARVEPLDSMELGKVVEGGGDVGGDPCPGLLPR